VATHGLRCCRVGAVEREADAGSASFRALLGDDPGHWARRRRRHGRRRQLGGVVATARRAAGVGRRRVGLRRTGDVEEQRREIRARGTKENQRST